MLDLAQLDTALAALNTSLEADQSRAELLAVEEDTITLRLSGSLCYCPSATLELLIEVEGFLRERVPGLARVRTRA